MTDKIRKKRKSYTKEFKLEAVNLVLTHGYTQAEACRSLGISSTVLLGRWIKDFGNNGDKSFPGKGIMTNEMSEMLKLKRENALLKKELDFLKKAATYFASQEDKGSK